MKVFKDNKMYVQGEDLIFLDKYNQDILIPESIQNRMSEVEDLEDIYEFVEFSSDEEIEFFKNCHYLANLNLLVRMSEEQLIEYMNQINIGRNNIIESYENAKDKFGCWWFSKRKEAVFKIDMLEYKILSVWQYLWCIRKYNLELGKTEKLETTEKEFSILEDLSCYNDRVDADYFGSVGSAIIEHRTGIKDCCAHYDPFGMCSILDCLTCENCCYKITLENGEAIANSNTDLSTITESGTGFSDDDYAIYFYDQVPDIDNLFNYLFSDESKYRLVRTSDEEIMGDNVFKGKRLYL